MAGSDVVFVVVDALRPDAVGHLDSPGSPTPTIDRVAANGVSFPNAHACINTTDPSITSIHSGRYPATTGLVHHGQQVTRAEVASLDSIDLLPEILSREGYETGAVDWLGRWHKRGFDHYTGNEGMHDYSEDAEDLGFWRKIADTVNANQQYIPDPLYDALKQLYRTYINPLGGKGAVENAETTTDRAIDLLEGMTSPRYLFVHYWDVHAPYETPRRYAENAVVPSFEYDAEAIDKAVAAIKNEDRRRYVAEILEDGLDAALAEYYGAASYVDDQLARLLERVPDDAYVVVMADHGESLFEHGIFFEHHGLYKVNTQVPLVIAGPDVPSESSDGFIQLCDVQPTILGRLGIDPGPVDGIDAIVRMEADESIRDAVFVEEAQTQRKRAIRTKNWSYRRSLGDNECSYCLIEHGDPEALYNLVTDPDETENVLDDSPEVVTDLSDRLDKFFTARAGISEINRIRGTIPDVVELASL